MYRFFENMIFYNKRFHLYFSPIEAYTTVLRVSV